MSLNIVARELFPMENNGFLNFIFHFTLQCSNVTPTIHIDEIHYLVWNESTIYIGLSITDGVYCSITSNIKNTRYFKRIREIFFFFVFKHPIVEQNF